MGATTSLYTNRLEREAGAGKQHQGRKTTVDGAKERQYYRKKQHPQHSTAQHGWRSKTCAAKEALYGEQDGWGAER